MTFRVVSCTCTLPVRLSNTLLRDDGVAKIAEALQANTAIISLECVSILEPKDRAASLSRCCNGRSLGGNNLSDVGLFRLGEGLKTNTALSDLK